MPTPYSSDTAARGESIPSPHRPASLSDRRDHCRVDVTTHAKVVISDQVTLGGTTTNVSFRGASITLDAPPEVRLPSHCRLVLAPHESAGTAIEIHAKIERVTHNHIAVQFLATDIKGYNHLRNLLLLGTHTPQQLLRELASRPGVAVD